MPEGQTAPQDPRTEFINVPVWHGSLDRAREILVAHPEVASSDIHTAALLGDHEAGVLAVGALPTRPFRTNDDPCS